MREEDLPILFEQQRDPIANEMAAFPARDRDAFYGHWMTRVLADPANMAQAILCNDGVGGDDVLAGNIVSFMHGGEREVGYWLGREFWGRGIATRALEIFLTIETTRPLHAFAVHHNIGSIRVLQKCGFTIVGKDAEGVTLIRYT